MKNKYQLNSKSHSDTCKLCSEDYFAKGYCKKHYFQIKLKSWRKKNPDYHKKYGRKYWKLKKNDLEFIANRKPYMKIYNKMRYLKNKLAKKSKSEDIQIIEVILP